MNNFFGWSMGEDKIDRRSAMRCWTDGKELFECAEILRAADAPIAPTLQLYSQSIESTFKAFLRSQGAEDSVLRKRKVRHDLEELLMLADMKHFGDFVTLTSDERDTLRLANCYYSNHDFRYPEIGSKMGWLELLAKLPKIAKKLNADVKSPCIRVLQHTSHVLDGAPE